MFQVTVEATVEHPFFVFGQGWSSCSPERTFQRYGLQCQRLLVGDVCISLTHRQTTTTAAAAVSGPSSSSASSTIQRRENGGGGIRQGRRSHDDNMLPRPHSLEHPSYAAAAGDTAAHAGRRRRWSEPDLRKVPPPVPPPAPPTQPPPKT